MKIQQNIHIKSKYLPVMPYNNSRYQQNANTDHLLYEILLQEIIPKIATQSHCGFRLLLSSTKWIWTNNRTYVRSDWLTLNDKELWWEIPRELAEWEEEIRWKLQCRRVKMTNNVSMLDLWDKDWTNLNETELLKY